MNQVSNDKSGGQWFIPLLIVAVAVLSDAVHTSFQLKADSDSLAASLERQEKTLADARTLRAQLEAIAGDTARLAEQGNPNAIRLRNHLEQQGVTIRPQPNQ